MANDRLFYALVNFGPQLTAVYIVPFAVVARVISTASRLPQSTPGLRLPQRKPNSFRRIEQATAQTCRNSETDAWSNTATIRHARRNLTVTRARPPGSRSPASDACRRARVVAASGDDAFQTRTHHWMITS